MSQKRFKFLIADDDELNLMLANHILNQIYPSAIVLQASNGQEALTKYLDEKPDILFLDIQMPEKNGDQTTKEIRQIEDSFGSNDKQRVPIIALTATSEPEELKLFIQAGMSDTIKKPIKKELFEKMLQKWLGLNLRASP